MTDDISKVVCHDCFGNGKKCLAGRNAHRTNWYDCETCVGTGHIERTAPSLSRADCQHAVTRLVAEARSQLDSREDRMNADYVNGYRNALRYIDAALQKELK